MSHPPSERVSLDFGALGVYPWIVAEPYARILSVGRGFPSHRYTQDELIATLSAHWRENFHNKRRLEQIHRNVLVGGRYLALPIERYSTLTSFTEANAYYRDIATDIGAAAVSNALDRGGLTPRDVDHIFFVSVTGIATPSIDARLVNRLGLRRDVKRTPIFGLGCVAGVAGVARAADTLRGDPEGVAVVVSVELCSLTLQRQDLSIANLIASGLFGDGAAAVVLAGGEVERRGPGILASSSVFYPDTEELMGWDIGAEGFRLVLSPDVPGIARRNLRGDVTAFLAQRGLGIDDIQVWISHTGGPRVLEAVASALELDDEDLELSWKSLRRFGNVSSTSVLLVLGDTLEARRAGRYALMVAMGPGFCSELILLDWGEGGAL